MTTSPRLANRVLLVGWGGVDWSALQTSMQAQGLPTLAALLHAGVSGPLTAPAPRIEQSLWTSLVTGQRAHKHGVLHSQQPLQSDRGTCRVTRPQVKTATLGAILSASGMTIHQVGWPVSHPVEQLRGIAVSDRFASESRAESMSPSGGWPWVTPPAAANELFARRYAPSEVEEVALAQLIPANLVTHPTCGYLQRICRLVLAESLTLFRVTKWCLQRADWDCTLCFFPAIGRLQEAFDKLLSRGQLAGPGARVLAGCYEHLDMLLGQIIATAGEQTTVMVVGMGGSVSPQPHLVLRSPALAAGALPSSASLLDVTPTLLTLLGIPVAKDMDGQVWTDLILAHDDSPAVAAQPVLTPQHVETWNTCIHSPAADPDPSSANRERQDTPVDESVRYLLELGYVDPLDTAAIEKADHCRRESQRNRALSQLEAGQVNEAIAALRNLKSRYPEWSSPYELLAETYLQLHQHDRAEEELEFLIHHGAESARLYFALGRVALAKREIGHALQHYHVAERIGSGLPGLHLARGRALLRQRDYGTAEKAFQQSLQVEGPSATALDGLAICRLGLEAYEAAAEYALAAVDQNLRFAPAHYHLAIALVGLGRQADAKQAFETSAALDSQFVAPLRWLARLCTQYLAEPEQAEVYRRRGREIIQRRRHQGRQAGSA